jgi:hypothetical protein
MNETIFLIEDAPEGGYSARALGESIFTEGETLDELKRNTRAAVECHFEYGQAPKILRLHFVREEILAL